MHKSKPKTNLIPRFWSFEHTKKANRNQNRFLLHKIDTMSQKKRALDNLEQLFSTTDNKETVAQKFKSNSNANVSYGFFVSVVMEADLQNLFFSLQILPNHSNRSQYLALTRTVMKLCRLCLFLQLSNMTRCAIYEYTKRDKTKTTKSNIQAHQNSMEAIERLIEELQPTSSHPDVFKTKIKGQVFLFLNAIVEC